MRTGIITVFFIFKEMSAGMKILKVINNNVVSALDEKGQEVIVTGKGIGFQKKAGDQLDTTVPKKVFYSPDETFMGQFETLVKAMDYKNIHLADEIIQMAKNTLGKRLNKNICITLTDHLNYAIERQKEGISLQNALLWEIKKFYKPEYQVGLKALEMVKGQVGVELPEDEAGFIALHLVNAEMMQILARPRRCQG